MTNILFLILGVLIGVILSKVFKKKELPSSGCLRLDHSDPDSPYLFLELKDNDELNRIQRVKKVCFDVKREDFIPQK